MTVPNALRMAVVGNGLVSPATRWKPLRGGRTNRVWRIDERNGAVICKLYDGRNNNPLYPNQPGAEYEALKALSMRDIAPDPIALLNTSVGDALIYRHIDGTPFRTGAAEVATLLARLHGMTLNVPLRRIATGSAALIAQTKSILDICTVSGSRTVRAMHYPVVPRLETPVPIHTDVVASNIIVSPDGLRLIDWQCPAFGDPCEDLASFLSPAMQYLYGAGPLPRAEADSFLAKYPDRRIIARYHRLAPLYHWRIAAYCLWKAEGGDADYREAMKLELSALQKTRGNHNQAGQNDADTDIA